MSHQLITIRLSRNDSTPWGFRLQGGKDFAQPLLIQKVNGGSLSERAGLQVGDALIKVNHVDVYNLKHKEAQDVLVKAGNSFELTIERGPGSTWKPQVSQVGNVPSPGVGGGVPLVTKTSLAANKSPQPLIGSGHNQSARPFGGATPSPQMQGGETVKAIVNKQYNTPVNIYSEESIAETLSAQAEVLAGGVLGVNFKKNEKSYDSQRSEVFKMVQEVEKEPKDSEPERDGPSVGAQFGLRHIAPPEPMKPATPPQTQLPPGQNICADCERLIVGVFVRIKDKNLHVECFKCSTCGTSLKNVGYYNINNKLYCDIHAKLVARQNPPAPNLDPITIPPGGKLPSSIFPSSIVGSHQAASPGSPQPGTIAPLPFHGGSPGVTTNFKPFSPSSVQPPSSNFSMPAAPQSNLSSMAAPPFNKPTQPGGYTSMRSVTNIRGGGSATGGGGVPGGRGGTTAGTSAPRRGRGVLNPNVGPQARIPLCGQCNRQIRGPFITALGKIWCPDHFVCVNGECRRPLHDIGFVEETEGLYCEYCFEKYLAPNCSKCNVKIKGDCLNAIGKQFHPECFTCTYCNKMFGNNPFFLEDSLPYCENDWNELFTTKCFSCGFPIEAGDRWVEALSNNYHSQCFNCTMCKKNLEGQSFFAKGGRPFCKNHAR